MCPYYMEKRYYSERAFYAPRYQPWVYRPLPSPYGELQELPRSKTGFTSLVRRLFWRHGSGRYKILRSRFFGESPGWKPVVLFHIRLGDGKYMILKRYTQYRSHEKDPQLWFKEHHRRLRINMDMKEVLAERRRRMLDQHRSRVKALKPKRYRHKIEGRTWAWEQS